MDDKNSQPTSATVTPEPSSQPATPVNYIGNTNIVDRSQSVTAMPQVETSKPAPPSVPPANDRYREASSAFAEAITVGCGVKSSISYLLVGYFFKNSWVALAVSALLAATALFFAFKQYRSSQQITPLGIVGISAATFTLVLMANYLVIRLIIQSAFSGAYY